MATTSRSFVQTLIGAIPAEEGATLVARAGEPARITSSVGSAEVGSIALTVEAIDEMTAQLLPPDQLQTLRQSGTCEGDFVTADRAGTFAVLAAATEGDRWIEVRRRGRVQPPSEETLVAELLSRSFTNDAKSPAKAAPAPVAAQAPVAPPPPVAPQVAEAPVAVAPPEPALEPSAASHDLDVPASFDFAAGPKFDADDLSLPGGLLDEPLTTEAPAAPARPAPTARPASVAPHVAATATFSDRLQAYGRLSVLLPAIVAVIGLPSAGWFVWMRHSTAAQLAAAPASAPMLKSKRLSYALLPHTLVVPTVGANFSALNVSTPAPQHEPPTPVALAPAPPTPLANTSPRTGFSIQVAAVRARDEADRMAAKFVQEGYSSYIVSGDGAAAGFYRVRIGAFADRQAAEDVAKKIERAEGVTPWIVRETR